MVPTIRRNVSIFSDNLPHLLEGDAAIEYYHNNLLEKKPTKEFTFQGMVPTIIGCILYGSFLGILLSLWFLFLGMVAFIVAHIIVTFVLTYFMGYTHNVQWYEETNQYVFILKNIISKKEEITIYNRSEYDYISLYKIVKASSGPSSGSNKFYSIRDEYKNDIMKLDSMQYDYKITEFAHSFSFIIKNESKE